jgi:molybdenum cofactor synthesis domain-containing protein
MEMRPFRRLIPWEVARARLLAASRPIARSETIPLYEAVGRVSRRTVRASRPVPAFPRATWDGYAFASDVTRTASPSRPVRLALVGELFAQQSFRGRVPAASAVAVATGARLPHGTDTVEIFEQVRRLRNAVTLDHPVGPGRFVAQRGDDLPGGATIARTGGALLPATLGALAASGRATVEVYARPVVSIVPNGDELLSPGTRARPGSVFESNNATLSAIVRAAGGLPRPMPPVADSPRRIEATLRRVARTSDIVVATGGSSVGEHDYLPSIFPRLGRVLFHGIALRPGKPTLAAARGSTVFIGMPGHPTSCLGNGLWLLLPVVRQVARLAGTGWIDQEVELAKDAEPLSPDRATLVPLRIEGNRGYPTFHDSHAITSLAEVGAFAILPPQGRRPRRGDRLTVHRLLPPLGPAPRANA